MENNDGTEQGTSAEDPNQISTSATTAASTYNAVYNSDGTITYNYGNGTSYTTHGYASTIGGSSTVSAGGGGYINSNMTIGSTNTQYFTYTTPKYEAHIDYSSGKIKAKTFELNGADVSGLLDAICDRLAIIENADPEQLQKYKALNEAYQRYKFLERMLVDKGDKDGN